MCISIHEICDKRVNCLYTMDDELGCVLLIVNVQVMLCHASQTSLIILLKAVKYCIQKD